MTTNASIGMGTLFKLARPSAPTTFITISERTTVGRPSLSRDVLDGTHMDSPDDYREFFGGLRDGGEVSVGGNLVPGSASEMLLIEAFNSDDPWPCQIEARNGALWEATLVMSAYEPGEATVDGKQEFSATFKISGKPTLSEP